MKQALHVFPKNEDLIAACEKRIAKRFEYHVSQKALYADGVPETGQTFMSDFWINGRRVRRWESRVKRWEIAVTLNAKLQTPN